MAVPDGRFLIALGEGTLDWNADFTRIDSYQSLVTSWTIDRGRQIEFDRTDTGRATVEIADRLGILDPTNASGPFYGQIEPLLQAAIQIRNPVDGLWYTRFRGWIDELDYVFDPSQQVNRLTISLVDIFEILSATTMLPGQYGHSTPPTVSADQVFYDEQTVQQRITEILADALTPARSDWWAVFSGNVGVWETVYSAGSETALTAIQEAADAEFPGSPSNVYCDRLGRLCFHGRLAKKDPVGTAATTGGGWVFRDWKAGDHNAVNADPAGTAWLNKFGFNRGLSHIINQGFATPTRAFTATPLTAAENLAQIYKNDTSIGLRGTRSWTAENLLTKAGTYHSPQINDLTETKRFAQWYVDNYSTPTNRVTECAFRCTSPGVQGATITWGLLSQIDIGDRLSITIGSPGGGGFDGTTPNGKFFIEGIHETCQPLNSSYDDITVTVDLSPASVFNDATWPFT